MIQLSHPDSESYLAAEGAMPVCRPDGDSEHGRPPVTMQPHGRLRLQEWTKQNVPLVATRPTVATTFFTFEQVTIDAGGTINLEKPVYIKHIATQM